MFDPFTLALIGGGLGALTSKKNPLKGAVTGAGLGAMGGAGLGALGSAPVASAATTASGAAMDAGITSGNIMANNAAITGVTQPTTMRGLLSTAKPYMEAAGAAQQVGGLLAPQQQPIPAPPPLMPTQANPQAFAQISQGIDQQLQQDAAARAARRNRYRG